MAVGLGIAAKRQQRPLGLVAGILLLVLHKMLEFGAAAVGLGASSVMVGLFLPMAVYMALAAFFYYTVAHRVGVAPLGWLETGWQNIVDGLRKLSFTQREANEAEAAQS